MKALGGENFAVSHKVTEVGGETWVLQGGRRSRLPGGEGERGETRWRAEDRQRCFA